MRKILRHEMEASFERDRTHRKLVGFGEKVRVLKKLFRSEVWSDGLILAQRRFSLTRVIFSSPLFPLNELVSFGIQGRRA